MTKVSDAPAKRAEAEQRVASDPTVSAFVAASAGSGKTKLLTDRLLRLMLAGSDPSRIQCLTFTKAAAAEMALRLQRLLGEWVTLPDAVLDQRLAALSLSPTAKLRAEARKLFATVLDSARRHANRHYPCVLSVLIAPVSSGGGAFPAFPAD